MDTTYICYGSPDKELFLTFCFSSRPHAAAKAAPAPAPAASAAPTPTATGPAAQEKGSSGGGGGSSGDAAEELWIVGRVLDDMDTRLGAKQEKIRESLLAET